MTTSFVCIQILKKIIWRSIRNKNKPLSGLSEKKNPNSTQNLLVRKVDRLLSFDYDIEHFPVNNMRLVYYFSRLPLEKDPKLSELDNTFLVAKTIAISRILEPVAKTNTAEVDRNHGLICRIKREQ